MPERIQLSRKKGSRLPPSAVNCARPGKWGNPFPVTGGVTAKHCVEAFREQLEKAIVRQTVWHHPSSPHNRFDRMAEDLAELRGKDLACWCKLIDADGKLVPCHADVLLELANAPAAGEESDR